MKPLWRPRIATAAKVALWALIVGAVAVVFAAAVLAVAALA